MGVLKMVDALAVHARRTPHHAMHLVSLGQQQLG
jgi:hypothetical protein